MPAPYRVATRRDPPALPDERILALAARPEGFHVSWRWRDEWLVHRCAKLIRAGRLRRIRRREKGAYFYGLPLQSEAHNCPAFAPSHGFDESLFG